MQPALRPREEAKRKSLPTLRTLVLNADYRPLSTYPLSIIAAQDAVHIIVNRSNGPSGLSSGCWPC
jgi:hypothetical protein